MKNGLRQGCPLSPFIFNCVAEAFSVLMSNAVRLQLCKGIEVGERGLVISHLQFTDDTVIMCRSEWELGHNIKKILLSFQLISGLRINFQKSSLIRVRTEEKLVAE